MNKVAFLMIAALLLGLCAVAFAQEFPDVPPDHWAYDAVQELVDYGIIQGYPDGTFGGKRAMTRYEFAEAMAKAAPVIAEMAGPGNPAMKGDKGDTGAMGPAGPAGPKGEPGIGPEQLATIQRMMDEFQDELASLGVQVESVRRDLNALAERVTLVEVEQDRVKITGDVNLIGRGTVRNSGVVFDRDARLLPNGNNVIANSTIFTDMNLGIKGRVGPYSTVDAVISAGNYTPYALRNATTAGDDDFTLWQLMLDTNVTLGPLGKGAMRVGRFPFQLTPLTLKFVDPDSYNYVQKLDSGDYMLDGGSIELQYGKVGLTVFAGKANPDSNANLITPTLLSSSGDQISQLAGIRAGIGIGATGKLGLVYYQGAVDTFTPSGRVEVWGGNLNNTFGTVNMASEYAITEPNDDIKNLLIPGHDASEDNTAYMSKLSTNFGKLGVAAGYSRIEQNYVAPGSWMRMGSVVNPVNVQGANAELTYALTSSINLTAEGQFLEPNDDTAGVNVSARASVYPGRMLSVPANQVDKINYYRIGLEYGLTGSDGVDFGYEQFNLSPVDAVGPDDSEERFITIGWGHTFHANASMKLLYQIIEYEEGSIGTGLGDFRGGVASAQFALKF